jgi:hypothetical protein
MTLPQPARAEKRSVETFTDDILALTDAAYADFQGAELRDNNE